MVTALLNKVDAQDYPGQYGKICPNIVNMGGTSQTSRREDNLQSSHQMDFNRNLLVYMRVTKKNVGNSNPNAIKATSPLRSGLCGLWKLGVIPRGGGLAGVRIYSSISWAEIPLKAISALVWSYLKNSQVYRAIEETN